MESQMELSFQPLPHCVEEQGLLILHLFLCCWQNKVHLGVYHFPVSKLPTPSKDVDIAVAPVSAFFAVQQITELQKDNRHNPVTGGWVLTPKCLHLFPVGWALGDISKSAHRTPQHCVDFPLQFLGKEGSWRHTKRRTGSKELSKAISFCKRGTSEPREGWWACSAQMTPVCYPWCKNSLTQLANWCKRRCVVHGIWVCGFLSTFDRKKNFYIVSYF